MVEESFNAGYWDGVKSAKEWLRAGQTSPPVTSGGWSLYEDGYAAGYNDCVNGWL